MSCKILVVDDSMTVRRVVCNALSKYDCEIFEAVDGLEGLTKGVVKGPDLIFLDVHMPNVDGFEFLKRLNDNNGYKHIPVIMLTSDREAESVTKALKAGAKNYMIKPFKANELIERASKFVDLKPKAP